MRTWYLLTKRLTVDYLSSIKNGIIDDSDIFAIDIDPLDHNHIIASACSGIYETRTAGDKWRKVQGIPSQSRRTRAIESQPPPPLIAAPRCRAWSSQARLRASGVRDKGGAADSWMVTTSRNLRSTRIAVHRSHPETVYIGTNNYGVMVSYDGAETTSRQQWRIQRAICKYDSVGSRDIQSDLCGDD